MKLLWSLEGSLSPSHAPRCQFDLVPRSRFDEITVNSHVDFPQVELAKFLLYITQRIKIKKIEGKSCEGPSPARRVFSACGFTRAPSIELWQLC